MPKKGTNKDNNAPKEVKAADKKAEPKKDTKKVEKSAEKKEKKTTEKKVEEKKVADKKVADKKVAEKKPAEKKVAEKKPAEKKPAEKKTAEKKEAPKKDAKKDAKPTSAPKKETKKAPEAKKDAAAAKKNAKKESRKQKPMSFRATIRQLMRKDPKMRKELAKGTKGLPKARAHAKHLKLMRKNRFIKFNVDCHRLAKDRILDPKSLLEYFRSHIKIDGKTHNFGKKVMIRLHHHRVVVFARAPFAKRYLKYLTKKYLKKNLMRDHVRVVSHGQNGYRLGYYKISMDEAEQEAA